MDSPQCPLIGQCSGSAHRWVGSLARKRERRHDRSNKTEHCSSGVVSMPLRVNIRCKVQSGGRNSSLAYGHRWFMFTFSQHTNTVGSILGFKPYLAELALLSGLLWALSAIIGVPHRPKMFGVSKLDHLLTCNLGLVSIFKPVSLS